MFILLVVMLLRPLVLDRKRKSRNLAQRLKKRFLLLSRFVWNGLTVRKDYEENHKAMLDLLVKAVLNVNPHVDDKKKKKN